MMQMTDNTGPRLKARNATPQAYPTVLALLIKGSFKGTVLAVKRIGSPKRPSQSQLGHVPDINFLTSVDPTSRAF